MRNTTLLAVAAAFVLLCSASAFGQSEAQLKSILGKIKNYRYGNISVFKLDDESMKSVSELLNPTPVMSETASKCVPAKQAQIDDKVTELGCAVTLEDLLSDPEIKKVLRGECMDYAKYAVLRKQAECNNFKRAYVVTTRYTENQPFKIIAMITSNSENKKLTTVLGVPRDIITYTQLRQQAAPASSSAKTLYQYLDNFVVQQHSTEGVNLTTEAQGIGDEVFIKAIHGLSKIVDEQDVEMYKRISDGQAMNYTKPNELVVSPDLISFRNYSPREGMSLGSDSIYNRMLPTYGVELRYGIDAVNIPSFFSDRVSLNAIWGWNKLGIILPTNGWSSLGKQLGMTQRLTHAGFGLDASFDFPIDVTNSGTGVFNLAGSYVFSDAVKSNHPYEVHSFTTEQTTDTLRKTAPDTVTAKRSIFSRLTNDFLIRVNAQLHYTFAVSVDSGNFFRFRIGGAMYSRETWSNEVGSAQIDTLLNGKPKGDTSFTFDTYRKTETKTIGGVSVRIDYMSMYVTTPYGFGLQYFDEAISGNAWMLIPINPSFGLRFEGNFSTPILRDPYIWENRTTFIPTARIIYNF